MSELAFDQGVDSRGDAGAESVQSRAAGDFEPHEDGSSRALGFLFIASSSVALWIAIIDIAIWLAR